MLFSLLPAFLLIENGAAFPPVNRTEILGSGRSANVIPAVGMGRGISNWPARIVAPYTYTSPWTSFNYQDASAQTGCKFWSLAFLQSDGSGNPLWGGSESIYNPFYSNYIGGIRANGGDVIVSFGGANSNEIADKLWDANSIAAAYQKVIDLYALTYIDVDIEGHTATNYASVDRRSAAFAILQKNNPNLKISVTIAVTTAGMDGVGVNIIKSAVKNGVSFYVVNLMTMDYGQYVKDMGQAAINAASGTYSQLQSLGMPNAKVGITAMIGVNDTPGEVFSLYDAERTVSWAMNTPYIGLLSFWESSRDTNQWGELYQSSQITQNKYDFHKIFMRGQGAATAPGIANWGTCPSDTSKCADATYGCCFGSAADLSAAKKTCRPPNNCYTGLAAQTTCKAGVDTCSTGTKCCSASASDHLAGVTKCVATCYTPVPQWNDCNAGSDVCATSGNQCCFGSAADIASGKTTCRPSANCYVNAAPAAPSTNPAPIQPDPKFIAGYKWSTKIFAPYVDITTTPQPDIVTLSNTVGTARYILGFITSDSKGVALWGTNPVSKLGYADKIAKIRAFGGDVAFSFGGPGGVELATVVTTAKTLQNTYQNIIDGYTVSWIDFHLDATAVANRASVDLRNQVLRTMQVANPNIKLSYSLPVTPSGFSADSLYVLQSAAKNGVRVDIINILAYNYGSSAAPNAGSASGTYALQAATFAYSQAQAAGINAKVGLSPMIGQSTITTEFFKQADASQVLTWAKSQPWVQLISFVSANRDNVGLSGITQKANEFASIFVQYEN